MDEVTSSNLENNNSLPSVKEELEDFKIEHPEDQLISVIKIEDNLKTEDVSFFII